MKPTTRLRILFLLFMAFNMTICYGQEESVEEYFTRKAGELQAMFDKMTSNAEMVKWTGKQSCNPQTLVNMTKNNISLSPLTAYENKENEDEEKNDFTKNMTLKKAVRRMKFPYLVNIDNTTEFLVSNQEIQPDDSNCKYYVQSYMKEMTPKENKSKRRIYKIKTSVRVICECTDDSTNEDIKEGSFLYEALINVRVSSSIKFSYPKSSEPSKLTIFQLNCCPEKDGDQDDTPKEDNDDTPEEDSDDNDNPKDDKEDHMANEEDEDCCNSEDPKQTIGFVPGIGLTNNFEDFSYDLGIEYLRNIGGSFGDDSLYAGALVGYMGENRQDGEVKETMWYAAGIIQNRSPFSFCDDLQWINQICVLYGEGQIDAFGNTDDFSTFSVGVHTGFNFQFNDKFAIGADVTVASIGSTTFTSENGGSEFKQDIGNLFVNKRNGVRFGFRFTF